MKRIEHVTDYLLILTEPAPGIQSHSVLPIRPRATHPPYVALRVQFAPFLIPLSFYLISLPVYIHFPVSKPNSS